METQILRLADHPILITNAASLGLGWVVEQDDIYKMFSYNQMVRHNVQSFGLPKRNSRYISWDSFTRLLEYFALEGNLVAIQALVDITKLFKPQPEPKVQYDYTSLA